MKKDSRTVGYIIFIIQAIVGIFLLLGLFAEVVEFNYLSIGILL